jgi:hypothetical protein
MRKVELHEKAIVTLKLIKIARKRKDIIYNTCRKSFHIETDCYMNKMYGRIEILNTCIDRLKTRYNKIIQEICMLS